MVSNGAQQTRRIRRGVLISYGVIALIGVLAFALSFEYEFFRYGDQVGPGYLPRIVGVIVAVLGIALMIQEVRVGSVLLGDSGVADGNGAAVSRATAVRLVTVFGLIILAVASVPLLGLIPPLVLLVFALAVLIERKPLIPSLVVTALAAGIAWGLFIQVLRIPIPLGIFEGVL